MPKSKQKFEVVTIDDTAVTLDMSYLTKNGCLYFNATKMAQHFGKDVRNWIKSVETKEYLNAVLDEYPNETASKSTQFNSGSSKFGNLFHVIEFGPSLFFLGVKRAKWYIQMC